MDILLPLIAAILPGVVLFIYINKKDSAQSEPTGQLIKAFVYGIVSIAVSLCITTIFDFQFNDDNPADVVEAFANAFLSAAIPEEVAKFTMLWLFLRKCKYYDEKFDGIVYSACVGLGFATVENIMYVFEGGDWLSVGVMRALLSVPGHFLFAVLMGYYYSLHHYNEGNKLKNAFCILGAPILAHGLFDGFIFSAMTGSDWAPLFLVVLLVFYIMTWRKVKKRIAALQGT